MTDPLEETSLLYKRADGTQGFVHDTYRNFMLGIYYARQINSGEMSPQEAHMFLFNGASIPPFGLLSHLRGHGETHEYNDVVNTLEFLVNKLDDPDRLMRDLMREDIVFAAEAFAAADSDEMIGDEAMVYIIEGLDAQFDREQDKHARRTLSRLLKHLAEFMWVLNPECSVALKDENVIDFTVKITGDHEAYKSLFGCLFPLHAKYSIGYLECIEPTRVYELVSKEFVRVNRFKTWVYESAWRHKEVQELADSEGYYHLIFGYDAKDWCHTGHQRKERNFVDWVLFNLMDLRSSVRQGVYFSGLDTSARALFGMLPDDYLGRIMADPKAFIREYGEPNNNYDKCPAAMEREIDSLDKNITEMQESMRQLRV